MEFGHLQSPFGSFAGAYGAGGKLKLELKLIVFEFKLQLATAALAAAGALRSGAGLLRSREMPKLQSPRFSLALPGVTIIVYAESSSVQKRTILRLLR